MKVSVDQEKCCAAGTCAMVAPGVFDQRDEDGIVVLLLSEPPADLHDSVREAASVCPAMAIHLSEDA
ncbi:ferredoxin [Amycolatopsis mediterranei S699]|uniref:Ferredoxin n=2 Tax=Amycolatopsis mediterranei TaxID=33910 RepID=A0A0H3DFF8_AMYMU|nr:ferredoxin [Amycolatopsis mediterranei]ADJ48947.1 ferredoxin [Amycolatopsis mediterranei U32]AEK45895.1 ferredoxin [Amycolatopsis mediterranei S699]AFO80655.1 ferredoxin [Amycolatopsis mediterranei S699]AGT87783.1 ferredoxin [Amycolatopsis mediterranei RB]KDU93933.1 ferredoxin [Amycolatopsis mediterranei]